MKKKLHIQVGTGSGWKTPVLNINNLKTGESKSTRISRKLAAWLIANGMSSEG